MIRTSYTGTYYALFIYTHALTTPANKVLNGLNNRCRDNALFKGIVYNNCPGHVLQIICSFWFDVNHKVGCFWLNMSKTKSNSQDRADLVAYWSVPLTDGVHTVEFEHGTTSGKRVIRVDGEVSVSYTSLYHL